ncbi:tRNA (N6-isopentenyl adenosine(37)-C2)-methylthiotransferase MiaB [Rubripirellula reticaptiva]|uniref:tRNA-2-methylthio-N(6)-dimethylallyladenosine synthase n=1 Tax=Rubripirellula reticaptiva TaxID=2528013 RepID=A0A5C6EJX3_9BACT|nr:tRNA (N6-isopentenyl adenosine(37)-C2)-methylthiotransferase MiaB [Rubripirellula reticaptiva]TWU49118.1 tRNA-2-methylthio-N(6)-dimethylallyladenosine synthase [Rubripirellula reticaptiva]
MSNRVYIKTVGCQMNVLDSEMVIADLKRHGYTVVDSADQADCVLYNTCSIREQAEEKTYSALGIIRQEKEKDPSKVIGVMGCMAQKDQELVFKRAPYVDLVVGPGQLHTIPTLLDKVRGGEGRQMAVSLGRKSGSQLEIARSHETFDPLRDPTMRPTPFQAYLRIQIGCDKFCTYCVVPNTRGPEQGRAPEQIYAEAKILAEQGAKEITLLGQTVNSYRFKHEDGTVTDMASLLEQLHDIDGIQRIKFVTNYPKDMTERLLETIRDLPKVSPYLHVPAQSGSDEVLKRMKRGYTVADYMAMMERIERILPEAAISSDFIVGFCGETEEDFQKTVELVKRCRYKNSFIFQYSVRPGTKASERLEDDVPRVVKSRRNVELLAVQDAIAKEDNLKLVGTTVEVLVEGPSKKGVKNDEGDHIIQMIGRTHCDRIVVFDGNRRQAGQFMSIHIDDASSHTLVGRVKTVEVVSIGSLV